MFCAKTFILKLQTEEKYSTEVRYFVLFQDPSERLGCHPQTGFSDIQSHPFFRSIDWELLYEKQIPPPYKPQVRNERDLEHFDPQFTNEPVQLTPDDP